MMTDMLSIELDGAQTLALMQVIVARMKVLEHAERTEATLAEMETLYQIVQKIGPQLTAHAARERTAYKAQLN